MVVTQAQVFKREGDYWTIAFDGRIVRLRDAKGVRYLSVLLRHPGKPLSAWTVRALAERDGGGTEAADTPRPEDTARAAERARVTVTKGIRAVLTKLTAAGRGSDGGSVARRGEPERAMANARSGSQTCKDQGWKRIVSVSVARTGPGFPSMLLYASGSATSEQ